MRPIVPMVCPTTSTVHRAKRINVGATQHELPLVSIDRSRGRKSDHCTDTDRVRRSDLVGDQEAVPRSSVGDALAELPLAIGPLSLEAGRGRDWWACGSLAE